MTTAPDPEICNGGGGGGAVSTGGGGGGDSPLTAIYENWGKGERVGKLNEQCTNSSLTCTHSVLKQGTSRQKGPFRSCPVCSTASLTFVRTTESFKYDATRNLCPSHARYSGMMLHVSFACH